MKDDLILALEENYGFYYSLVYSVVLNHSDVEDVLQDVRCRILAYEISEDIQNIRAYLTAIAKNAAYDHVKNMPAYVFIEETDPIELSYSDEHIFDALFQTGIESCMMYIPEDVRPALIEHFSYGEKISVLGRKYDLSRKTLRYWQNVFLKNAKKYLK